MKKTVLNSLLAFVILSLLSFSALAAPTVLEYWTIFTGPDGQTMQALVDQFNEENQGNIEVRMSIMPGDNFYESILTAVISGRAPDVAIMHMDRLPEFAAQGILLELDEYVENLGLDASQYIEAVWDGGVLEGKRYGVPLDAHPLVMYWNKDIFAAAGLDPEAPPMDRESFIEVTKSLTKDTTGDGTVDQWGTQLSVAWPNFQYWYSILFQNGGELFNADNTKAVFNSPEAVDALQYLVDLIYVEEVSPANVQVDADVEAFKRGEVAIEFNGIWMLNGYREHPGLNFGAGMIPQWGTEKPAVWAGSHQFIIPQQRRMDKTQVTAALDFIKWIGDHSLEWGLGGQLPAKLSVLESEEFLSDPHLGSIAESAPYIAFPHTFFLKYGEAVGPAWDAINKAFLGELTPQEALDEAVDLANRILAD